jgi:hypothetical protein
MEPEKACKGGQTDSHQMGPERAEQCQFCGMTVAWDFVDDPFFGFAAGCPKKKGPEQAPN